MATTYHKVPFLSSSRSLPPSLPPSIAIIVSVVIKALSSNYIDTDTGIVLHHGAGQVLIQSCKYAVMYIVPNPC